MKGRLDQHPGVVGRFFTGVGVSCRDTILGRRRRGDLHVTYNISGWKRVLNGEGAYATTAPKCTKVGSGGVRGVVVASRGTERPRGPPRPGEGAGRVLGLEGRGKGGEPAGTNFETGTY